DRWETRLLPHQPLCPSTHLEFNRGNKASGTPSVIFFANHLSCILANTDSVSAFGRAPKSTVSVSLKDLSTAPLKDDPLPIALLAISIPITFDGRSSGENAE